MDLTNRSHLTLFVIGCCIVFCVAFVLALELALHRYRRPRSWTPKVGAQILSKYLADFEKDDALHEEQAEIRRVLKGDDASRLVLDDPAEFAIFCVKVLGHLPLALKPYAHLLF